ncbi:hypothetical protein [uncultured Aliiroseovarius sp.]|uniref:hypothetical protein n=1 Tax=uncultured Aliiroseovarius sp. TaxID=1658783 RepID=UPI00259A044C|nr:hypothetical protein [uncultured Aliiroseovarius sp.]
MKPNFALDLSHDGIGLVHRGKGGWTLMGEVSLDDPDMAGGLDVLRRKAADLESTGISCKLIIPGSQILFTGLTAPGPDDATRTTQIRDGLQGLTPYDVTDLVFDWHPDPAQDGMVHVAVVARDTLDEAEAFANEHRMNPVSFVARPLGNFSGEAFFGPVSNSNTTVQRDSAPVPDLSGEMPDPDVPAADISDPAPALPALAPFPPTPDTPATAPPPPKPATSPGLAPEPDATPQAVADTQAEDRSTEEHDTVLSGIVPSPPPLPSTTLPTDKAPTFASRRTADPVQGRADSTDIKPDPADMDVSPRLHFGVEHQTEKADRSADARSDFDVEKSAQSDTPPRAPVHVPVTSPTVLGDDSEPHTNTSAKPKKPTAPPAKDDRQDRPSGTPLNGSDDAAPEVQTTQQVTRKPAKMAEHGHDKLPSGPFGQTEKSTSKLSLPKLLKREDQAARDTAATAIAPPPPLSVGGRPASAPNPTPKSAKPASPRAREAETLTVFGARQTNAVGGKPKYLGLFLVLGLLLLMVVVAIWSMFFLNDGTARLFPEREDPFEAAISGGPDPDDITDSGLKDASAALDRADDRSGGLAGVADPMTPEAAQARYAATGIWQRAPEPLGGTEVANLNDLYIASIDPQSGAQDAVALPDPNRAAGDAIAINTAPPPPLGTTFTLDSDGMVVPTPDGALSPAGIMIYEGRPARVPAPAPRADSDVSLVEDPADIAPTVPRITPRARPEGLIEGNERLELGGRTRAELAVLRPRLRPSTPQAQARAAAIAAALGADADENAAAGNPSTAAIVAPTDQAIAQSIEPRSRPRGFNKIVARTNAARTDASDGSVAVAAASTQQNVVPNIPTRASVAKQATIKNAINLRKISLIGIYGSSSSRRALVRLKSGRYVKVAPGSRLDGGSVLSISASELVYKKGSRTYTLKVVPFG